MAKVVANSQKKTRGGAKPGERRGGRKRGTPNKKNADTIKAVESSGLTPLDYMLSVMRDETFEQAVRMDAAKAAAPYVHPRLTAVEHTGKDGKPIDMHWTITVVDPKKRA